MTHVVLDSVMACFVVEDWVMSVAVGNVQRDLGVITSLFVAFLDGGCNVSVPNSATVHVIASVNISRLEDTWDRCRGHNILREFLPIVKITVKVNISSIFNVNGTDN